jgi:hypothetical protein
VFLDRSPIDFGDHPIHTDPAQMLVEQAASDRRSLVQSFEFSELLPRSCLAGPQGLFDPLLRGVDHVERRDDVASFITNWHEGVRHEHPFIASAT